MVDLRFNNQAKSLFLLVSTTKTTIILKAWKIITKLERKILSEKTKL